MKSITQTSLLKLMRLTTGLVIGLSIINFSPAWADDTPPPPPANPAEQEHMRQCQIKGAQQAWGAQARFIGAPMTFKYIDREQLKKMFYDEKIPNDGIYLANDMDPADQQSYQNNATYGWQKADEWVKAGVENPGSFVLTARFYFACKDGTQP